MNARAFRFGIICLAVAASALPARAETWPTKPVTMITPAAAGNSPDVTTRIVADKLTQIWKQQIIVINRPGAGGAIAAQAAAAADRDGYTLYMTQASSYTVLPVQQKLPFDIDKEFVPIGLVGVQPITVAVTPSLPVATLPDLIALVKKTPGGMFFGATNRGGQSHLTGELLRSRAGIELTFVHAQGLAASLNDVTAGRIPILFEAIAGVFGAIQGGSIKPIAIAAAERLPTMPNLPTFAETLPGFQSQGWIALMAPAGTPDDIVKKVNADLAAVVELPDVKEKFAALGTFPRALTPAQTGEFIRREEQLWWPVVRAVEAEKK
jgi:tripartite-type tricarboxylate transporter receptor subunit TctC